MSKSSLLIDKLTEAQSMWWQTRPNSGWSNAEEKELRDNEEARHKLDMVSKTTSNSEKKKELTAKKAVLSAEYDKLRLKKKLAEQKSHGKFMADRKAKASA